MTRHAFGSLSLALLGTLVACGNGTDSESDLGSLRIAVTGLPAEASASLTVTGPDGFSETIGQTITLIDLEAGTYTVDAPDVMLGDDRYTSTVNPASAMVVEGILSNIAVTYLLEAEDGPRITDLTLQGKGDSDQIAQGTTQVTLEATGEGLANATIARLGTIGGTIDANNDASIIATFEIPMDQPVGRLDLEVVADAGVATFGSAVAVTAVTAGGEGDDATGFGTPDRPLRSLTQALIQAPDGANVVLLAGTFDEANGEVWPIDLTDREVLGSGSASTVLMGSGSDSAAHLEGNSALRDLQITNFTNGLRIFGGNAVIEGVESWNNTADGLNASAGTNTPVESVEIRDSTFRDNGLNGIEAVSTPDTPAVYRLENVTATDNGQRGIYLVQAVQMEAMDVTVEGNDFQGVALIQDSSLTATRLTIRDNDLEGLEGSGNTTVDLVDGLIRGNQEPGVQFSGDAFTMRDTTVLNNIGGGVRFSGSPVVDLGTAASPGNNRIGLDNAGISIADHLIDDRSNNSTPAISAVGVDLGATPAHTGLITGPDADSPYWMIDGTGNQIDFGL
ncbi:MAG: right-handed parallel beta-helix repeat-containing protein [Myxococcota bacterium]